MDPLCESRAKRFSRFSSNLQDKFSFKLVCNFALWPWFCADVGESKRFLGPGESAFPISRRNYRPRQEFFLPFQPKIRRPKLFSSAFVGILKVSEQKLMVSVCACRKETEKGKYSRRQAEYFIARQVSESLLKGTCKNAWNEIAICVRLPQQQISGCTSRAIKFPHKHIFGEMKIFRPCS